MVAKGEDGEDDGDVSPCSSVLHARKIPCIFGNFMMSFRSKRMDADPSSYLPFVMCNMPNQSEFSSLSIQSERKNAIFVCLYQYRKFTQKVRVFSDLIKNGSGRRLMSKMD